MKVELNKNDKDISVSIRIDEKIKDYDKALLLIKNINSAVEITKVGKRLEYESENIKDNTKMDIIE